MKQSSHLLIFSIFLIACAMLGGCGSSSSLHKKIQGTPLFPDAANYLGETVRVFTYDTLRPDLVVRFDSIGDESESGYRLRYAQFVRDEPSHPAAFLFGEPIQIIDHEKSEQHLQVYRFEGFTTNGLLVDDSTEISVGSMMSDDTITTTTKRKSLSGAELLRSFQNNDIPIRGTFYFRDTNDASKQYAFKNCAFDRAIIPIQSVNEASHPTLLGQVVGGVIEFVVGLIFDPPHTDTAAIRDKQRDEKKLKTKNVRIVSGEDRAK